MVTASTAALADRFLPYSRHPSWLGPETTNALLTYALENNERFQHSTVQNKAYRRVDTSVRESLRLTDLGPFSALLKERALSTMPAIATAFGIAAPEPREIEIELIAHGDGAFFKRHTDTVHSQDKSLPTRRITLVYYLHRLPKTFTGGQFRYYALGGKSFIDMEPECDELIAFPSWAPHSVQRVSVPGDVFADRRFAVNIWMKA